MARPGWARLLVSLGTGAAFAVLVAIVLVVVDLYLTGHGHRSIRTPLLAWAALGVHLSLADVVFLGTAVLGTVLTWRSTTRGGA